MLGDFTYNLELFCIVRSPEFKIDMPPARELLLL